jgi:hypothetical protein
VRNHQWQTISLYIRLKAYGANMSITIRVIAKIDAKNFRKVSVLPSLKDATIAVTYDVDLGDGATASCESEEGLLDFLRCLRADSVANPEANAK